MKLFSILPILLACFQFNAYSLRLDTTPSSGQPSYLLAQNNIRDATGQQSSPRGDFRDRLQNAKSSKSTDSSGESTAVAKTELTTCSGQNYALCAGSTCKATGGMITVKEDGGTKSVKYPEAQCTCPVINAEISTANGLPLEGYAALNEGNMNGSCIAPAGHVWSYFSQVKTYPQESYTPKFTTALGHRQECPAGTKAVNCWNYLCTLDAKTTNGAQTATCSCPIGEGYFGGPIAPTESSITYAGSYYQPPSLACSMLPVSGPVPTGTGRN